MFSSPCSTNAASTLYKYSPHPSLATNTYVIILPTFHMDSLLTTLRLWYPPPDQRHHWTLLTLLRLWCSDNQCQNDLLYEHPLHLIQVFTICAKMSSVWTPSSSCLGSDIPQRNRDTASMTLNKYLSPYARCFYTDALLTLLESPLYMDTCLCKYPGIKLSLYMDILLTSLRLQQLQITQNMFSYHSEFKLKINI